MPLGLHIQVGPKNLPCIIWGPDTPQKGKFGDDTCGAIVKYGEHVVLRLGVAYLRNASTRLQWALCIVRWKLPHNTQWTSLFVAAMAMQPFLNYYGVTLAGMLNQKCGPIQSSARDKCPH